MTPLDEALARVAQGDRRAFDAVFDAAWPRTLAWCARSLSDPRDAEDAAQRALERVFEQAVDYDPRRSALSWILTIAAYEVRTARQRRRREQARVSSLDALDARAQPADPVVGADDALIDAESADELARLLDELPPDDRALVEDALAGRAYEDSNVPAATQRKRRQRAIDRLKSAWRALRGD